MTKENKRARTEKTFLGMPMRWEKKKMFENLWNQNDDRVFPPKYFGVGWDLNFYAVFKKAGLIKTTTTKSE